MPDILDKFEPFLPDRWTTFDQGIRTDYADQQHEDIRYTAQTQPDEGLIAEHIKEIRNNPRLNASRQYMGDVPKVVRDVYAKQDPGIDSPDPKEKAKAWRRFFILNPEWSPHRPSAFKRRAGESGRRCYFRFT